MLLCGAGVVYIEMHCTCETGKSLVDTVDVKTANF